MEYVPRKGNRVMINPHAIMEMERDDRYRDLSRYFKKVASIEFTVENIEKDEEWDYRISISAEDDTHNVDVFLSKNGSLKRPYSLVTFQVPLFMKVSQVTSDLYCSCNGQKVENEVMGKKFMFCRGCKKEVPQ